MMTSDGISILRLNYDCLDEIFSYLKLRDLMNLEDVCQKFKEVAHMRYRVQHFLDFEVDVPLDRGERISLTEAVIISLCVGPYVTNLSLSSWDFSDNERCLPLPVYMLQNFYNLKEITLDGFEIKGKQFIKGRIRAFESVKTINLIECDVNDEGMSEILSTCTKLKNLVMVLENYRVTDCKFLAELRGIEGLSLEFFDYFTPTHFREFCEHNPQLVQLAICNCITLERACLESIARNLKNLKKLSISAEDKLHAEDCAILGDLQNVYWIHIEPCEDYTNQFHLFLEKLCKLNNVTEMEVDAGLGPMKPQAQWDIMEDIAKFKTLKRLILDYMNVLDDFSLEKLSCCNSLEEISVERSEVTAAGLTSLIKKCPRLKKINLTACRKINLELIENILPYLRHRHYVLKLLMWGTPIHEALKDPTKEVEELCAKVAGKIILDYRNVE